MAKLRALWRGDLPLGEAFWTYAVSLGLVLNLLTTLLFLMLLSWDRPLAALFVAPGPGHRPLPAVSLTDDVATLTALANDVGFELVFARQLAALADLYVDDAFAAAHRAHASTEALAHRLPAYAGREMQAELEALTKGLEAPQRPVIALVGYTNAGKSTLFNRVTGSDVMAENLLFATLDPTLRQISSPGIDKAILSDTVGFVSELPTQLVAAFKATLEEVVSADLLIHVRDVAHPDTLAQKADVEGVLGDIGVAEGTPVIEASWCSPATVA